jgi:3-deoxy-manno-octulosonate cytidylyltransferase (CMP-KDO synthetase)
MKVVGVIPARWASTRLPGKVLVDICGKPMVQHVWEQARASHSLHDVIIACDEQHVLECCQAFGAKAVLTDKEHPSGSDRIAQVIKSISCGIVVNIQSDEPLLDPQLVDAVVDALAKDKDCVLATPVKRIQSEEEFRNPNVVKTVLDKDSHALYFSRAPIPFRREGKADLSKYFKHLGLYAYRRDFLLTYCSLPKSFLEEEEKLEQLRALEAGFKIKCVETAIETIGVDTLEDVQKVVNVIKSRRGK